MKASIKTVKTRRIAIFDDPVVLARQVALSQRTKSLCGPDMKRASRVAGLHDSAVRDVVVGRNPNPSLETLIKLARSFGCSVGWLIGEADEIIETETDPVARAENKFVELAEQAQEIVDFLKALDLIGDGVGGERGFAISAVALQAKTLASDLLHSLEVMAGSRSLVHVHVHAYALDARGGAVS